MSPACDLTFSVDDADAGEGGDADRAAALRSSAQRARLSEARSLRMISSPSRLSMRSSLRIAIDQRG